MNLPGVDIAELKSSLLQDLGDSVRGSQQELVHGILRQKHIVIPGCWLHYEVLLERCWWSVTWATEVKCYLSDVSQMLPDVSDVLPELVKCYLS